MCVDFIGESTEMYVCVILFLISCCHCSFQIYSKKFHQSYFFFRRVLCVSAISILTKTRKRKVPTYNLPNLKNTKETNLFDL